MSKPPTVFRKARHFGEWLALAGAAAVLPRLPRQGARWLGGALGRIAARADIEGRRVAMANLAAAFPNRYDDAGRRALANQSYQHFARAMVDLFWARNKTEETVSRWIDTDLGHVGATSGQGGPGTLFITPHYGNFEWLSLYWPLKLKVIAQEFKNPRLTSIFAAARSHTGHRVIPQEGAFLHLLKHISRGGSAAMLPDLTTKPGRTAAPIKAFGMDLSVTILPALLAARIGCPVVPAICHPLPGGRYRFQSLATLRFTRDQPSADVAQACWDVFESAITENPAPWLWMYKHWRYLPEAADPACYPFYANRSKAFDCLRDESKGGKRLG